MLFEDDPGQGSLEILFDQLHDLAENPVRINSAGESEIARLFFLNEFQVQSLAEYVRSSGNILSVYEIAAVPGFDRRSAELILPFIDLSPGDTRAADPVRFRSSLISNFIISPGEKEPADTGLPFRLLTKYRFTAGRLSGGFTTEKDKGEKMFDFLSGHLAWSGKGFMRKIIIGDISSSFGQGLCINTGFRTYLSPAAAAFPSSGNRIRPFTSTDENNFFRGAAVHLAYRKAEMILLASHNLIDAATAFSEDSSKLFTETFYKSGIHNTLSSIEKKDALAETSAAICSWYNARHIKAGICWSGSWFSLPVRADLSDPGSLYEFSGSRNDVVALHYSSMLGRILLYGELAMNDLNNYAMVQGAVLRPSDRLGVNVLLRNYSPGFTSFHGNGPGTSSSGSNEKGILGAFTFEAAKHLFISAGCDLSSYPWLRYRTGFPSSSRRTEIRIRYVPSENLSADLVCDMKYSMINGDGTTGLPEIDHILNRLIRGQLKYSPGDKFTLATRIDFRIVNPGRSTGMMMLQDLVYRPAGVPLSFWFRYCIFNTGGWDSRLYAWENDLLYSFSIPALSGRGSRSYIMAEWEIGKIAEMRVKYALTSIRDMYNIIEKDELKVQLRLRF
ncbi:MAG: helix-hairpin-helix domain-containing protein [Bacteroidales bacterium]|nr:helix-hairpin-helix domain-containing protein [Bacteroidales bacterium]